MTTSFLLDLARARGGVLVGLHDMMHARPIICGARTRKGTECKAKALPGKTRCKFHGGASTGPKTPEGGSVRQGGVISQMA